jgi:hypothetical protein
MERKVFLFIVLAFGLFVGKAQTVSKERLIEIADSVYNLPRFADYQIKNGEPVIIEKETADLPLEQLLQRPSSSPFYGCTKPKCKYYIVRYPCDTEVYNTLADLCAMRVYIWAKSQRVFNVALGNGIHLKVSYGGNGEADF